jgi:hypothetical protein
MEKVQNLKNSENQQFYCLKRNIQATETDYYIRYKEKQIHPINNNGKINIVLAFIFISLGLSDSRALRWIEEHFMET